MPTADQFKDYSAIQLATEAAFISWVKCPDESNDIFWKDYVEKYPLQKGIVEKARVIVNEMKIIQPDIDTTQERETWKKISEKITEFPSFKVYKSLNIRRWVAAAAIFIIVLGAGGYFILHKTPDKIAKTENILPQNKKTDIAPGGNKAVLTLANGSTIILDSAQNGTLSSQGNIKIIKLDDGQLAYDKSAVSGNTELLYNTISTPKGGQYQLTLSDGSKVWLNAASSLKFPAGFSGKERKVELTGEGYFEVAHNAAKPFIVTKNNVEIKVLGTHFNVNAYDDENSMKVTLLEGSVKVSKGDESIVISPGQQAGINNLEKKLIVKKDVDLDEVIAWKNGLFQFDQANIKTIMRQIARWYDVDVVFEGKIPEVLFGGKISRDVNVSQVLKVLQEGGIHFRVEGKKIIVTP
jgi:ferric-dicitrate binding protein FerR (iron transport regulator)